MGVVDEYPDQVQTLLEEQRIGFPTLHDKDSATFSRYGVTSVPTIVVIDRNGVIVKGIDHGCLQERRCRRCTQGARAVQAVDNGTAVARQRRATPRRLRRCGAISPARFQRIRTLIHLLVILCVSLPCERQRALIQPRRRTFLFRTTPMALAGSAQSARSALVVGPVYGLYLDCRGGGAHETVK